jgi:hypothetical protein
MADGTDVADVTAQNNLFVGGTYTTTFHWDPVGDQAKWVVTNNAWVNGAWSYDSTSADGTCSNQSWSGNSIVTIDSNYNITSTVKTIGCIE